MGGTSTLFSATDFPLNFFGLRSVLGGGSSLATCLQQTLLVWQVYPVRGFLQMALLAPTSTPATSRTFILSKV